MDDKIITSGPFTRQPVQYVGCDDLREWLSEIESSPIAAWNALKPGKS